VFLRVFPFRGRKSNCDPTRQNREAPANQRRFCIAISVFLSHEPCP